MLVYVTSLYAVRDEYLPVLHQNFQQLLPHLLAPVYVFTDAPLPFPVPPTVHIISHTLTEFHTYVRCLAANARLPKSRNASKDTAEFMALMNTKVEMVWRAIPYIPAETTHIAWIDAGIWKIVNDPVRGAKAFVAHPTAAWPTAKIALAGCLPAPVAPSSDAICWRFCGGFLVIPTSLVAPFYKAVEAMLEAWLTAGHLAWEVNIWAALEWKETAWFAWWGGDHNATMLEAPAWMS